MQELQVAVYSIVLPEGEQREGGFVFLEGHLRFAVDHPRVPRCAQRTVSHVFVKQHRPVAREELRAEREELSGHEMISGPIEHLRDERAVAGPHVAVCRPVGLHDVRVVGREDGPLIVDLGAHDQHASPNLLSHFFG